MGETFVICIQLVFFNPSQQPPRSIVVNDWAVATDISMDEAIAIIVHFPMGDTKV